MLMSEFITAQKQIQLPATELIAKAAEEKVRAEMKAEEQAKELQVLQEENNRLRDEIEDCFRSIRKSTPGTVPCA